jgi:hypothetical protein
MEAPRDYEGHRVLYYARIPREIQETKYTYPEFTHPVEHGRTIRVESLVLVEWGDAVMLYEIDAEGAPLDDTFFDTAQEAFDLYHDVEWQEIHSG